jgi:hypothetical protein
MFVMFKITTSGDVNTFEVVLPTFHGKARDDAIKDGTIQTKKLSSACIKLQ